MHRRAPIVQLPEVDEYAGLDRLDRPELDEDFEPTDDKRDVA